VDTADSKCKVEKKKKKTTDDLHKHNNIANRKSHFSNYKVYQNYKYCLVMENSNPIGYLTEKLLGAYLGGCLPIYWGSKPDVYQVFNKESFFFWNVENATKSLTKFQELERNETLYRERLQAPVLRNGSQTVRDYFSLTERLGGGYLQEKIHQMVLGEYLVGS
jgi:hypothetical protein